MKRLIFLLTFTVFSITLTFVAQAKTIVTDGLVSYWTFDRDDVIHGTVKDVWGENDAMIKGNPTIADGYLKQGLKFDGEGDYVILTNFGNFGSKLGPFSFEVWLKTSSKNWSTIYKVIEPPCDKRNRGSGIDINAWSDFGNPGKLLLNLLQGDPDEEIITKEDFILIQHTRKLAKVLCLLDSDALRSPISDGKWHHIVYVFGIPIIDGSGEEWKEDVIYIDSIRKSLGSFGGGNPDDFVAYTEPVYLGATNDNGKAKRYFRGMLDEVRVYNRTLTDEEVIRNYNSGIGLAVRPTEKLPTVWGTLKTKH